MCTWTPTGRVDGLEKSTSGGILTVNGEQDQNANALSSGEAEYYAMVTGCEEGLGMQSLAEELGWKAEI